MVSKNKNKDNSNPFNKYRRTWTRDPIERIHSTKKGKRGYDRNKRKEEDKYIIQDEL